MRLYYGSYAHVENEAAVTIDRSVGFNDAQQTYDVTHTWTITGMIYGPDQNTVISNYAALEAAYSKNYKDLVWYGNDGTTVAHSLRNAGSVTGVRIIKPPSYPKADGGELTTWRSYTIVAEAKFFFSPRDKQQLSTFSETVRVSGGGPLFTMVETVEGVARRVKVRNRTAFHATQSGQAVGRGRYPVPPGPIWPGFLLRDPEISRTSPRFSGVLFEDYGVSWSYEFGSGVPLAGLPHLWPSA